MPNASFISGLRPIRNAMSGYYAGAKIMAYIPAADLNAMAVGDPVQLAGDANPAAVADMGNFFAIEGEHPTVALSAAGDPIWGVIDSFEPLAKVGYEQTMYRQGGVGMFAHVIVDPNTEYEIQAQTGVPFTTAMVGQTCDLVTAGVDTVYGRSGYEADLTTLGNAAANQLLILGLQGREADNEIGDMAKLRVKINNHQFSATGVAGA